ncbi:MAG: fumarate hydratase C-terminal domain-containing protein [Spirochaetaceae bacterium]|jgi:fumarate hydratase subunit beta|nr:fumarate hydratase C-terminal domain-containing protein [Spirochaetaceae bacterium]
MTTQKIKEIKPPFGKKEAAALRAGDTALFCGVIYTARDAAHKRIQDSIFNGEKPPLDLENQIIFYAGPSPAPPGRVIGSIAATTSERMDCFLETIFKLGVCGTIGKGERSPLAVSLCKKYGGVYFLSVGGAAALTSSLVKSCSEEAYADLGSESIKRLEVENLPLIVGIDSLGGVFGPSEIEKYSRVKKDRFL